MTVAPVVVGALCRSGSMLETIVRDWFNDAPQTAHALVSRPLRRHGCMQCWMIAHPRGCDDIESIARSLRELQCR